MVSDQAFDEIDGSSPEWRAALTEVEEARQQYARVVTAIRPQRGSNPSRPTDSPFGDQPKIVGFDVEHDAAPFQDACLRVRLHHVLWRLPSSRNDLEATRRAGRDAWLKLRQQQPEENLDEVRRRAREGWLGRYGPEKK